MTQDNEDLTELRRKLHKFGLTVEGFIFLHEDVNYNRIYRKYKLALKKRVNRFDVQDSVLSVSVSNKNLSPGPEIDEIVCNFQFEEGTCQDASAGIRLKLENWREECYLLLPGAVYNGNRFHSRKIPYSPKLIDEKDLGPDKPVIVSDIPRLNIKRGFSELYDRSGSFSHPAIIIWFPKLKEVLVIEFEPSNELGDLAIYFTENADRDQLSISFQSPVVREKFIYTICNNQSPTPDVPYDFSEGDRFSIRLKIYKKKAESIEEMIRMYPEIRGNYKRKHDTLSIDLGNGSRIIEEKFNRSNWVEKWEYYSVGMRENFLQDWQIGWTGGMISTYPLYLLGDQKTRARVIRNFEWFFRDGFAPGGLPWDSGQGGNKWYGGDIRREITANRHLVRKSADAIYYLVKQFYMLSDNGFMVPSEWISKLKTTADIFLKNWERYSQTGQFLDTRTSEIVVGGSTGGAILPAGLVLLYRYTQEKKYLELAAKIADHYYQNYLKSGISCGGVGDALQCADCESSYGLCESFILLYEETKDEKWLGYATLAADFYSTWVMSWDYEFSGNSIHGKMGMKTGGTVFANSQNKHECPGICAYSGSALLRIYRHTANEFYINLLEEIVRAIPQYLSTGESPIPGLKEGWVSERINTTDWLEGIGETMNGSTWAETSFMLSKAELPSVYFDIKKKKCWCFDQLKCEMKGDSLIIETGQKTTLPLTVSILAESPGKKIRNYSFYGYPDSRQVTLETEKTIVKT